MRIIIIDRFQYDRKTLPTARTYTCLEPFISVSGSDLGRQSSEWPQAMGRVFKYENRPINAVQIARRLRRSCCMSERTHKQAWQQGNGHFKKSGLLRNEANRYRIQSEVSNICPRFCRATIHTTYIDVIQDYYYKFTKSGKMLRAGRGIAQCWFARFAWLPRSQTDSWSRNFVCAATCGT